ncbi:MAG TPA: hypothetical protein VKZ63_00625 [Kofleriaceae bacterium]|nr:hypothetical protein [Kofleriaceae bacterium]
MRSLAACVLLSACGRLGFEAAPRDADPEPVPDAAVDAAIDADVPLGPFGAAEIIPGLEDPVAADDDPSLTGDLLEIYFKSDRATPGDFDIFVARRASTDEPFGAAERVDELSTTGFEATPEVSLDGLTIYLAVDRPGGMGGTDLWRSTRASRDDPWDPPELVADLSSSAADFAAVRDQAEQRVVFNRQVNGHSFDLFEAVRDGDGWSVPEPIPALATMPYEADAHLSPDGLLLLFAGELGEQGRDIYRSERPDLDSPFGPPEALEELATASADEDPWLSPDGRLIVFSSDRGGDQELYWARR